MTAIITGASRGIGKALAYEYARHGFDLILTCEKNVELLEQVKSGIEKLSDNENTEYDVHKVDHRTKVKVVKGLLDKNDIPNDTYILVNNAGKCHYGTIQDTSFEKYKEVIESNLDYTFLTTKAVCDVIIKNKQGIIVNISSMWGILGSSCETVYSMTKGGVNAFTKALSKELKESGVDVIAFALGAVDTDMNNNLNIDERKELLKTLDGNKMFTPEEVALKIYDIVSNKNYYTGDIIELNNGLK